MAQKSCKILDKFHVCTKPVELHFHCKKVYCTVLFICHVLDAMSFSLVEFYWLYFRWSCITVEILLVRWFESEKFEKCPGYQIRRQVGGKLHSLHDKRLPGWKKASSVRTTWYHIWTVHMLESHLYLLAVIFVHAGNIFVYCICIFLQYRAGVQSVCRLDRLSVAYLTPCMRNVSLSHHHHHHHHRRRLY